MKRILFRIAELALYAVIFLLAAEAAVRLWHPTPRRALAREDRVGTLTQVDGIWLWPDTPDPPRRIPTLEDADCDLDGAFRIVLVGDSIFNGISLPAREVASVQLKAELATRFPDTTVCVVNLSVPGFSLYQGFARLRSRLDTLRPHLVLVQLWGGPPTIPVRIADTVVHWDGAPGDPRNGNPFGLPDALHQFLFGTSDAYAYAVVASPRRPGTALDLTPHEPLLDDMLAKVRAQGGEMVTLMMAPTDHPWSEPTPQLLDENADYEAWTRAHDVPNVRIWEAFADLPFEGMGIDPVHLSARGHDALTDVFLQLAEPRVRAWTERP